MDPQEKWFITKNLKVLKFQEEITFHQPNTREWFAIDGKVKLYTGLPNVEILDSLFLYISDGVTSSSKSALAKH